MKMFIVPHRETTHGLNHGFYLTLEHQLSHHGYNQAWL